MEQMAFLISNEVLYEWGYVQLGYVHYASEDLSVKLDVLNDKTFATFKNISSYIRLP